MTRNLLTGNGAAAWGARLAGIDYIPAFPITPQTEIIETLANWIDNHEMPGKLVTLESEHSMITAAGSAAATGTRVFAATSSQGLLHAMEMLYTVPGWRVPFVLVNVSRGLATPLTLEADHNDIMAARDSGCLQLHCCTCQEVLDTVLIAYRLAEQSDVRLPVIVNLDGFHLSFTREPVTIPDVADAAKFVGAFEPGSIVYRANAPLSHAMATLGGSPYSYFRYEQHLAAQRAAPLYDEIAAEFNEQFGREHPAVESYRSDDADYLFFMIGAYATKGRDAVDRLREAGWKIGLIRPRLLRPYPTTKIIALLKGKKAVAIIDQNISMGMGGVLHSELAAALYGQAEAPPILASFIGGLGGRDISAEEFYEMAKVLKESYEKGVTPPPRLLYTEDELRQQRKLQAVAHVEREELAK
jgi:pyruvate ferredoxin oxidoreductase alpha subunit